MTKAYNPVKRPARKPVEDLFVRKMTPDKIARAKDLFSQHPRLTYKDVADTIGVSRSTIRKYLPEECAEATVRNLQRFKRVRDEISKR